MRLGARALQKFPRSAPTAGRSRRGAYWSRGSCGAGSFSQLGSTPQIWRAYSAIVRSLENLPDEAMFMMALRAQASWFCGQGDAPRGGTVRGGEMRGVAAAAGGREGAAQSLGPGDG